MSPTRTTQLQLETLGDRIVPAVDLTTFGADAVVADGAIVHRVDSQWTADEGVGASGQGGLRRFLRMDGNGVQRGINTDANQLQFDTLDRGTRSLQLGRVPVVTVDGVEYREFVLNVNQTKKNPFLSLTDVRVFTGSSPTLTNYNATTNTLPGGTKVWDLDSAGDETITLKAIRNEEGAGPGEMALLIPNAAFANATDNTYIYLFSRMTGANGNAEAWGTRQTPPVSPPPPPGGPSTLTGRVFVDQYFDANENGQQDEGEVGNGVYDVGELTLGGVEITLSGVDLDGNNAFPLGDPTDQTADADGIFSFAGIPPGIYQISISGNNGYVPLGAVVGDADGDGVANEENGDDGFADGFEMVISIGLNGSTAVGYGFIMGTTG